MGYVADEGGRWRARWAHVHKIPTAIRMKVDSYTEQKLLSMETDLAERLVEFLNYDSKGQRIVNEIIEAIHATPPESSSRQWTIVFSSTMINSGRRILEIEAKTASPDLGYSRPTTSFLPLCEECLGSGIPLAGRYFGVPSRKEISKALSQSSITIPTDQIELIVPSSIRKADRNIGRLLDQYRGEGVFDEHARLIERTIEDLDTKHLIDYRIQIISMHQRGSEIPAMTSLGELTPIARFSKELDGRKVLLSSYWEVLSIEGKSWENTPKTYSRQCPKCNGGGLEGSWVAR